MSKNLKTKIISFILLGAISFTPTFKTHAQPIDESITDDYDYYQKFELCKRSQKRDKYKKYEKYTKNNKKYGFDSPEERLEAKDAYKKYKQYKKNPVLYRSYAKYFDLYKKYSNYDKYVNKYSKYKKYKKYKKYNKSEYKVGKNYCNAAYEAGYNRYLTAQAIAAATVGEANLGDGPIAGLGPEISVGLTEYSKSDLQNNYFSVKAYSASAYEASGSQKTKTPLDYVIKNNAGVVIATVLAAAPNPITKVRYTDNHIFRIYDTVTPDIYTPEEVTFEAANPAQANDIVFDFNRPSSDFDGYRGKLKLRYYSNPDATDTIWAINTLPLEEYVWGMGEIAGTGPTEHNKVMTTVFRTYGYWKMKFSTKYAPQGFKVNATPGNQLYYGYDWESTHLNIRTGAQATRGRLVMYVKNGLNEIALTPYSSYTDGRTRSFEERWGSTEYPWCQSVADPYGKHPSMTTQQLEDAGNHMVGLSAHGSLALADTSYGWSSDSILNYYFRSINLRIAY
jgi:hypothetical protein